MRTQHGTVGLIGIAEYLYVYVHDGNIYSLKNIFCRYIASFLFANHIKFKKKRKLCLASLQKLAILHTHPPQFLGGVSSTPRKNFKNFTSLCRNLNNNSQIHSKTQLHKRKMQVLRSSSRSVTKVLRRNFNKTAFREPDPSKPKIVLAYSGGLDTSCQLSWLAKEKGFEVCAYIADLGQDDVLNPKDVEEICAKAEQSGAYAFYCEDLRKDFVENYIFKSIKGNGLYENRYLLGTSVARPCIGKRQVEICWEEGAKHISHGSTGKGNDQVRFELCYLGMDHSLDCVTLWRDPEYLSKFEGRQDLIDYATTQNIPISQTKKHSYSEDENMMHISYESGELEDPAFPGHENEYPGMVLKKKSVGVMEAPDEPAKLTLDFQAGVPVRVKNFDDGTEISESVQMYVERFSVSSRISKLKTHIQVRVLEQDRW